MRHHVFAPDPTRDNRRLRSNQDMTATSLAGTVQESKAQRQERLKNRFRDRGGCVFLALLAPDSLILQHKPASSCPQKKTHLSTSCLLAGSMESHPSRSARRGGQPLPPNRVHRRRQGRLEQPRHRATVLQSAPHANQPPFQAREMKMIHLLRGSGVTQ